MSARYPSGNQYFNDGSSDLLYIRFNVLRVGGQNLAARNAGGLTDVSTVDTMEFLAPPDFNENIIHSWEEYDSVATRIAETVGNINKSSTEALQMTQALTNLKAEDAGAKATLAKAYADVGKASVNTMKPDAPLTFKGSSRREYSFTFHLAAFSDSNSEIITPVKKFRELSCATMGADGISFNFPNIVEVVAVSGGGAVMKDLLWVRYAAVRSVQTSMKGPFVGGLPTFCDLSITVTDIEPLYRTTFTEGGHGSATVTVSNTRSGR